jgi:DNA-binding transcriptional LysR family regulator
VLLGDPLFTRSRSGLELTPRAISLVAPVREILVSVDALIANREFDPASDTRRFRIGASDYSAATIMPALVKHIRKNAPQVVLEFESVNSNTLQQLEVGLLDLSFWGTTPPTTPYHSHVLFREHYVCVVSKTHPLAIKNKASKLSLRGYVSYPHITVSLRDPGQNAIDVALEKLGVARKIAMVSNSFVSNIQCLAGTDLIATLPSRLCAGKMTDGLVKFDIPLNLPDYDYSICWHSRVDADAGTRWLRAQILEVTANKN